MQILLPGSEITKNTNKKKLCTKSRFAQIFPSLSAATSCRQLSQLSHAVASFDICCKLLPALAANTSCCQLWQLVQAVASFASTMRLIPKSTDQLYAIPIDCIAVDLIIQVSAMLQLKREKNPVFPSDVREAFIYVLAEFVR